MLGLEKRVGDQPRAGLQPPHLQLTQLCPSPIREALANWLFSGALPGVEERRSVVSIPTSRALWLHQDACVNNRAFMAGSREFAHMHADGSLHLCMSLADEEEVVLQLWGEFHPWRDRGVTEILVYGPRNDHELETVKSIVAASYEYATAPA